MESPPFSKIAKKKILFFASVKLSCHSRRIYFTVFVQVTTKVDFVMFRHAALKKYSALTITRHEKLGVGILVYYESRCSCKHLILLFSGLFYINLWREREKQERMFPERQCLCSCKQGPVLERATQVKTEEKSGSFTGWRGGVNGRRSKMR
jgi:hypothetical protein